MWDIIPFRAAYVPIRPYLVLKDDAKTYYDRFPSISDDREFFIDSLLRASKLNATIKEAETSGQCLWVNNSNVCTGIMRMMYENEVDTSLLSSTLVQYQTGNLFPDLKFGSFDSDTRNVFVSTPQEKARNADVNPFDITKSIPWTMILLNILSLMTIMMIINHKLWSRDKRISFMDAILMHTFQIHRNFLVFRRKLMFFFGVVYCFFVYCFISSCISSDLVVDIPAKYLNSLQDVLESNRTPALMGGFSLTEEFESSQSKDREVKKLLLKRMKERNTIFETQKLNNAIIEMTLDLAYKDMVVILEMEYFATLIKTLFCRLNSESSPESAPKLKVSKSFDQVIIGHYFSPKIDNEVAYRWSITSQRFHQSGCLQSIYIPEYSRYCVIFMDLKQTHAKKEIAMPFFVFKPLMMCFSTSLAFAFSVFIIECLSPMILKCITRQAPENQNSLWIKSLKFLLKVVLPKQMTKKRKTRNLWFV